MTKYCSNVCFPETVRNEIATQDTITILVDKLNDRDDAIKSNAALVLGIIASHGTQTLRFQM